MFTHACKHLHAPFYSPPNNTSISASYLRLFFRVVCVIHVTDATSFWCLLRNWRINWPPLSKSTWCLSEARLLPSQSGKSRKCWERKAVLGSSPLACTCRKMKPRPSLQPRSQNPSSQCSDIQGWVILFTKQNITSNYSRPVFYSLLPHVGFIAVCKCQDTYKRRTV